MEIENTKNLERFVKEHMGEWGERFLTPPIDSNTRRFGKQYSREEWINQVVRISHSWNVHKVAIAYAKLKDAVYFTNFIFSYYT